MRTNLIQPSHFADGVNEGLQAPFAQDSVVRQEWWSHFPTAAYLSVSQARGPRWGRRHVFSIQSTSPRWSCKRDNHSHCFATAPHLIQTNSTRLGCPRAPLCPLQGLGTLQSCPMWSQSTLLALNLPEPPISQASRDQSPPSMWGPETQRGDRRHHKKQPCMTGKKRSLGKEGRTGEEM